MVLVYTGAPRLAVIRIQAGKQQEGPSMHRKDMIQMIVAIALILVAFFAIQSWLIPDPPERPKTDETERDVTEDPAEDPVEEPDPTEPDPDAPPTVTEPDPATADDEARGFRYMSRGNARIWQLRNSRLTADISERGAVLETVRYVNHKDEVVYLRTPNNPRTVPSEPLTLLEPLDIAPNLSPLALLLDEHDDLRNTSRWELVNQNVGNPDETQSLEFRFPPSDAETPVQADGTVLFKTITLHPDSYRFDVYVRVENHGSRPAEPRVGLWGPVGITNDGERRSAEYTRVALYGSTASLRFNDLTGSPRVSNIGRDVNRTLRDMGRDDRDWVTNRELDEEDNPDRYLIAHGLRTQYYLAFLSYNPNHRDGQWGGTIKPIGDAGRTGAISLIGPPLNVPPASDGAPGEAQRRMLFYVGPRDKQFLSDAWKVDPPDDERIPVQWEKLGSSGFFDLIASPLIWVLRHLTNAVGAGLGIIFLTLIVRFLLSPLSYRGQKAMAVYAQKMKVVKPKLDAIKEKYAGRKDRDSQMKMLTETRAAMREENVGMLPLGGCLPMLIQLPIFIGLFRTFGTAHFLRQAEFLWIRDLSLPDATIPGSWYIGEGMLSFIAYNGFLTLNILPVLWIVLAIMQFRMQPKPDDPQQQAIQKQMGCLFPAMGVIFYGFASGFALYFIVSSLYSIGESKLIKHNLRKQGVLPPPGSKETKVKEGDKPDYHTA
jgi:YidC/Oxa1 family membrane protein insertase